MRIVVALGGNALLRRGERPDASVELDHIRAAALALAPLCREHQVLICHGNGPQIGLLAIESANDISLTRSYPLDALGAQTQGMIGYWLAQCLRNAGVDKPVLGLVTQIVVDPDDPAFDRPEKFIGAGYPRDEATRAAAELGWTIAQDGERWRRVVPSPEPVRIVEQDSITSMLAGDAVVIAGGGGGAPVAEDADGRLRGVEAVVDKDLTSALLAQAVTADVLMVLTDVTAVMTGWGTPDAARIPVLRVDELADLRFAAGSMGPKIEACRRFVAGAGRRAVIGALADASALLTGSAGTTVTAARTA